MKATVRESLLFYLGVFSIVFGLGMMWLPLGIIAGGVLFVMMAVILWDRRGSDAGTDGPNSG